MGKHKHKLIKKGKEGERKGKNEKEGEQEENRIGKKEEIVMRRKIIN